MSHSPVTDAAAGRPLGESIRRLRAARGLTQTELAAAVGVSQAAVSEWEQGRSHPRRALLRPLADALDVHLAVLSPEYLA